jgi:hypothetical protein
VEDELCNFIFLLKSQCFKCVKTVEMLIIFKAMLYAWNTFAKHVSHTLMLKRVVPWKSVSCDNVQDDSVELMRVCKGSAVEESLETLHSRWDGGQWCGSCKRQSPRVSKINICNLKNFPALINYRLFSQIKGNSINNCDFFNNSLISIMGDYCDDSPCHCV